MNTKNWHVYEDWDKKMVTELTVYDENGRLKYTREWKGKGKEIVRAWENYKDDDDL